MKTAWKLLSLLLALTLLVGQILPFASRAANQDDAGRMGTSDVYWSYRAAAGALTVYGSGKMPDNPSGSASAPWYQYRFWIRSVTIKSGVTSIVRYAFYDCSELSSVSIPDSVTEIGEDAFSGCSQLRSITLPRNLKYLAAYAFDGCSALESIEIPAGVTTISGLVFRNCSSLHKVTLHPGLEEIGKQGFRGAALYDVEIPYTVNRIGESAFEGCPLKKVRLSEGLEEIGYRAFCGCSLKEVTLPASLKVLRSSAFEFTPLRTVVQKSRDCILTDQDYSSGFFGGAGAAVYAWPGSTTQEMIEAHPEYGYLFQPLYFDDVTPGRWYVNAVRYAKEHELFSGISETTFAPDAAMTRAMAVTVLWRCAGKPESEGQSFADVPAGAYYSTAVGWAFEKGIVNGVGSERFAPDGTLTREQLATILYRFAQWQGEDTAPKQTPQAFPDQDDVSGWARDAVRWAVEHRILQGVGAGGVSYLQPRGFSTRAQVATILMRYIEQVRTESHPVLYVAVEPGRMNLFRSFVETYTLTHENVTVVLSEQPEESYLSDYRLDWTRDVYLTMDSYVADDFCVNGQHPVAERKDAFYTPCVLAADESNTAGFTDAADVVKRLLADDIWLGVRYTSERYEQYYIELLLKEAGASWTWILSNAQIREYGIGQALAEAVRNGDVQAAAMVECEARAAGLTIFHAQPRSSDEQLGRTLSIIVMQDSLHAQAAADFAAWLAAQDTAESTAALGFYPVPDPAE